MRRINLWHKSKLSSAKLEGTSPNCLSNKLSVNEEYLQTFKTQSYKEMWDKVQIHLELLSKHSKNFYLDLSKSLLEPHEDTLNQIINESSNFHQLLVDYFEASLKACNLCQLLLQSIHQTRSTNNKMKKVFKIITKRLLVVDQDGEEYRQYYCRVIFRELKSFSMQKNPLSIFSPIQFHEIHDGYFSLLYRLTSKRKKIEKKARVYRFWKRLGGVGLVISYSALLVALLVFIFHSMFGIVFAAPTIMTWTFALFKKKKKKKKKEEEVELLSKRGLEGLSEQLDAAAKGVFVMINDFDTMSRMVSRLNDEIEHRKLITEICARNEKCELLRQVVKEFCAHESSFLEQLEELEAHIYLCLLNMNRSRRLVIQEIIANQ